jgi:hypothetical protein
MLRLRQAPALGGQVIGVQTDFGDGANQAKKIADTYQDSDLLVHTNDGAQVGYTDKARVSGTVYFPTFSNTVEFQCALSNPLIERAPTN